MVMTANANGDREAPGWLSWSNLERTVRVILCAIAGVNELALRPEAQPYVLLFVLAGLGLPEAVRLFGKQGSS